MPADEAVRAEPNRAISRRTLAKGAAWTTPVLLAGVVTPANAASAPADPCQCLVGYSVPVVRSTWSVSNNGYSLSMRVVNSGCGALNLFFSTAIANDNKASYAVTYTTGTTATLTGRTESPTLLLGGTITGSVTVPSGQQLKSVCVTMNVAYTPLIGAPSTCPLKLCWVLETPTASSGNLLLP